MNNDTPETDQWEAYCDECYYHMWRLRRKTERGWHDGFHINKGDEAKGLCDLLNNLERELAEARGQVDALVDRLGKTQERMIHAERKLAEAGAEMIRWMSIAEGRGRTDETLSNQ